MREIFRSKSSVVDGIFEHCFEVDFEVKGDSNMKIGVGGGNVRHTPIGYKTKRKQNVKGPLYIVLYTV